MARGTGSLRQGLLRVTSLSQSGQRVSRVRAVVLPPEELTEGWPFRGEVSGCRGGSCGQAAEACFWNPPGGTGPSPSAPRVSVCTKLGGSPLGAITTVTMPTARYLTVQLLSRKPFFNISKSFSNSLCSFCFFCYLLRFQKLSLLSLVPCNLCVYPSTPTFYILCAWAFISEKYPARQQ